MKESIGRIQQDGYSKPLRDLVKGWSIQKSCVEYIKKDNEHSFFSLFNHNELCCYHEGLVEESSAVLLELCLDRVIEVNTDLHELLKVNGEEVSGIEHAQVLDLSDDGERWEGDVLNNQPYGWGMLFDKEGEKVYEGFRIGSVNVCYGIKYYSDVQKVEYEGEWCEGKRWGRGVQYDRNGNTVFDGEWMDDERIKKTMVLNEENPLLHNHIEELIVSDGCCNGRDCKVLDYSCFIKLRRLVVGKHCFMNVEIVRLIGLSQLESVVIGYCSFIERFCHWRNDRHRCFYLKNCERLRELGIACYSFSNYSVCEIENLPSLEVVAMGGRNRRSRNFSFASLKLRSEFERMK